MKKLLYSECIFLMPVDLGRGPSHHVVVCYTSCFKHQDKYCFVLFGTVATLPTLLIRWSGYENAYTVWDSLFLVWLWDWQTVSLPITSGTHTRVYSLFFFLFFRHTASTPSTSGTHTGGVPEECWIEELEIITKDFLFFESRVLIEMVGIPGMRAFFPFTMANPGSSLRFNTHWSVPPVSSLAHSVLGDQARWPSHQSHVTQT